MTVREQAILARNATAALICAGQKDKDQALSHLARLLTEEAGQIDAANQRDVEAARASGLPEPLVDRLVMNQKVIGQTVAAVEYVQSLNDPVGARGPMVRRPEGFLVGRQRVPLGVIGIVYESRPNVTIDAACLCLKAGNAVLLRGGKEARETNRVLGELLSTALISAKLPAEAVQIVSAESRDSIGEMISLSGLIDLVIPRGGEGLIRYVTENARVPVIQHYKGVCHLFLDAGCDIAMATRLALNGKVQRPSVCNALECLLVDSADAARVLPQVAVALVEAGVELRGCPRTVSLVAAARPASDTDYGTEFLDKILAVRVVDGLDGAIQHVRRYGSLHSEAICTNHHGHAERWLREVDASCVLVNASTRLNDGGQLGLGAEIGISTSKLHAYGPMGLESLTTEKWIVLGDGQVRN